MSGRNTGQNNPESKSTVQDISGDTASPCSRAFLSQQLSMDVAMLCKPVKKRKNNFQCLHWKGNCIWNLQTLLETVLLPCFLQCFWKWFWYCPISICFQNGFTKIPVSLSIKLWRNHRYFSNLSCTFTRVASEVFSGKWNMTAKVWLAG